MAEGLLREAEWWEGPTLGGAPWENGPSAPTVFYFPSNLLEISDTIIVI